MSDLEVQNVLAQMRVMASKAQGIGLNAASDAVGQADFSSLLKKSIDAVSSTQKQAGALTTSFAKGDPDVNLAQVMVALQKASVSFEAMSQVRNKLVDAYQEIMRMNV